jgi:hypothetical protein
LETGDVVATYADVAELMTAVGFRPETAIEEGYDVPRKLYREIR